MYVSAKTSLEQLVHWLHTVHVRVGCVWVSASRVSMRMKRGRYFWRFLVIRKWKIIDGC